MATLLHAFTPGDRPTDQVQTDEFLARHAEAIQGLGIEVVHLPAVERSDYEEGLRRYWGRGQDIILLEQDLVPTLEQLAEIRNCPHALCAFAYRIHPVSTALPEPVYVHRRKVRDGFAWIDEGEAWADLVGFGLTRFTVSAQDAVPLSAWGEAGPWVGLDVRVSMLFHRLTWPLYRYHGDFPAILPALGAEVRPGETVRVPADIYHPDLERMPDGPAMRFHVHWPEVQHNHK